MVVKVFYHHGCRVHVYCGGGGESVLIITAAECMSTVVVVVVVVEVSCPSWLLSECLHGFVAVFDHVVASSLFSCCSC